MSTEPSDRGRVRPAAVVNEEIRGLLERTRRRLSDPERAQYEGLLREYATAVRTEALTAA